VFSNRALAFRKSISQVPFRAAYQRVSDAALHSKLANVRLSGANKYPAAVLAFAAAAVAVAPLTASAATTGTHTAATAATAAKTAAKPAAAAPKTTAAKAATATTQAAKPAAAAAAPQAKAAAVAPAKPYAGTSMSTLEPTGTVGSQSHFTLDSSQWANATSIVDAAHDLNLSPYAATIAVATSMQESKLRNLTVAVDHDSLGLFQQRPSTGWGSPSELEDPTYAAKAFLSELPSGYQHMTLHEAAQDVQRSFDGYLYAQWEDEAAQVVHIIANS
jgi:nucleoid-associated protein YgaU